MTDFAKLTFSERGQTRDVEHGSGFAPKFDSAGLIPAIVTDAERGGVLMFAWMNREALQRTLADGEAWFFSRSRNRLWRKGEDSGNVLRVVEMRTDCDQDALWLAVSVAGQGVACHTGARSCFYRKVEVGPAPATAVTLTPSAD